MVCVFDFSRLIQGDQGPSCPECMTFPNFVQWLDSFHNDELTKTFRETDYTSIQNPVFYLGPKNVWWMYTYQYEKYVIRIRYNKEYGIIRWTPTEWYIQNFSQELIKFLECSIE